MERDNMEELIFVCTGNTCRSPMAEGLFRALDGEARTGLHASSAGLFAHEGLPASEYAEQAAQNFPKAAEVFTPFRIFYVSHLLYL